MLLCFCEVLQCFFLIPLAFFQFVHQCKEITSTATNLDVGKDVKKDR